jgi:hypothetical protein
LTQDIDNILNAETKKIEDEVAVPPAYDQLNPLQFFEQYAMYLENPNPDPAEQASLEKIEKFFEKENNGVHDYWQNRYYLEKAIDAARRRHLYTGDKSAEHYITRMQVPTPDSTSKTPEGLRQGRVRAWASALKEAVLGDDRPEPPESLRQGREHDWVSFLKEAARHAVNTSRDDVIGHALMVVAKEQREYYSNLKLVEKALDPKTSRKEALKALDDLELAEVPLPTLPGENVTNPKAVADRRDKEILEQRLKLKQLRKRTDLDIAKQNEALARFFQKSAMQVYGILCENAASDPELLASLKADPLKWVDPINKQLWEAYKRDDSKRYEIMKMKYYKKESNRQFRQALLKDWLLLFYLNTISSGTAAGKDVMSEIMKILKQPLGSN